MRGIGCAFGRALARSYGAVNNEVSVAVVVAICLYSIYVELVSPKPLYERKQLQSFA